MQQKTYDFSLTLDLRAEISESPLWDESRSVLWLSDVLNRKLIAFSPDSTTHKTFVFPEVLPSVALCRSGRLLVTQQKSILLFDPTTGKSQTFAEISNELHCNRLNDGKVGPDGCFWVGSMNDLFEKTQTGFLWRVSPSGRVECKLDGLTVSNGLAWSPDGRLMYHADTRGPWIDVWDFEPLNGTMSNRRRLATLAQEEGRPDGGACDTDGRYWSAGVSAGCINIFSPTGGLVQKIAFPVPAPTMPCFGGAGLKTLYVTSLRSGRGENVLRKFPTLGGLFSVSPVPAGSPVDLFRD
jgi:sugar lactone lactonase YvrE